MLDSDMSYYVTHPVELCKDIKRGIRRFIQRGTRGYANEDLWSIVDYLSDWLPDALRKMSDNSIGYPPALNPYEMMDGDKKIRQKRKRAGKKAHKLWKKHLNDMADGFEALAHIMNMDYEFHSPEYKKADKQYEHGMKLFAKWFPNLWD